MSNGTTFDLVIRGGTVVDGTGVAPYRADIGICGSTIREVGAIPDTSRRVINAEGDIVTPGFVDIHTHYDGQVTWDSRLQPSSWHGVTTVVMGNCGVGFAPAATRNRDRLIELMEGIEDIPGAAMHEGIPWTWESFPEYLDTLAAREFDADVVAQVPHAAVRVHVMGERAAAHAEATKDEVAKMAALVQEAIRAGAAGFSTSRSIHHKSVAGEVTPTYNTGSRELIEIARAVGSTGRGVLQMITDFADVDADLELMRTMVSASGRPMSVTVLPSHFSPQRYKRLLAELTRANDDGLPLRGQVPVRGIGLLLGLSCTLNPFMRNDVWLAECAGRSPAEQALLMADRGLRERILHAQDDSVADTLTGGALIGYWEQMFELTNTPDYEPSIDQSIGAIARRTARSPAEVAYDALIGDEGRAMLYVISTAYATGNLDPVYDLLTHKYTVPGLSDGGAHVGTICDGSFPSTLLQHWVRERNGARLDLADAIRRQCRDTALAVGLTDRGVIAPGLKADINVIDLERLEVRRPEMRYDLPSGGKRLLQRADGYKHTIVSGRETYRNGEPTDQLPGRLVRLR